MAPLKWSDVCQEIHLPLILEHVKVLTLPIIGAENWEGDEHRRMHFLKSSDSLNGPKPRH